MSFIVVVGSLNMDLVSYTNRMPVMGETITGRGFEMAAGGKGSNQAYAASRLGAQSVMIGRVGDDIFGPVLKDNLRAAGVDTSRIETLTGSKTGIASITVVDGNNCIILSPGANYLLSPEDITEHEELLSRADMVLVQLEIPLETTERVIQMCWRLGTPVLLDPAPAQKIPDEMLSMVSYITPNETEAEILTGVSLDSPEHARKAIEVLRNCGAVTACITLGENGVVFNEGERIQYLPAFAVDAVDTTAAGDAFSAAFAVGVTSKLSVVESVDFARRISAISVTRQGAQPSLPSLGQFRKWTFDGVKPSFLDNSEIPLARY